MKATLGVCLLSALIAGGTALQCEVCTGLSHNCTGEIETCAPEHDFCGITMFESEREDFKVHGIVKNCIPFSVCAAGSAVINLGKRGRSRTTVFCCKDDACNTVSPTKLPLLDTRLNGMRCPACYATSSEPCSEDTVDCTGLESQCIDLAAYVDLGKGSEKVAMKGCASQAVCATDAGGTTAFTGASSAITKLECRAASASIATVPSGVSGSLLLATAGLLLIKL
ncbi:phospholipase A2 inhibitor and Ly6/PLAUR domain-containing protein-like [Varanus komodoensis]|uniref:phospholipase A2 inhibitor and Ly6/PLAUR domain-containing protein-like n=1 Tax=Varanus komodoensis TaxID=61221 RepID=UPI001CF77E52|nr:phospholipase A2 inhibitor and Ly6/PLAUR domain-containing protein-like [Varanus komodoensis]